MEAVAPKPQVRRFHFKHVVDSERLLGILMLAPAVLFVFLLTGVPFFYAIYLSLNTTIAGRFDYSFVGLQNYIDILQSSLFRRSLANTFVFTIISQVLVLVLAKILALALANQFRGRNLLRFLILLPWAAPIALSTIGWKWMFDSQYSVVNWLLRALHIIGPYDFPQWLGEPHLAMAAVIFVHVWRMLPFATVILLAGMTSIPQDVMDAAAVDGANFWTRLVHILIPLMLPIMSVALLFGVVFTFTDMGVVYVLTRGGPPVNATHVLASWAFQIGIISNDLGQGAAISLFLFPVLLIASIFMLRLASRTDVGV